MSRRLGGVLTIALNAKGIMSLLKIVDRPDDAETIEIAVPVKLKRGGFALRLVLPNGKAALPQADDRLLKMIATAREWWKQLVAEPKLRIADLAAANAMTESWVTRVLRLAFLDPDSDAFVFPGARKTKPLSVMAFDMQLRRLDREYTVHGFRSAFRDWVGEETAFQREVAEAALAHTVGDEVERAYRRGDALEKRRKLMEAWARYCEHGADETDADQAAPSGEERADVIEFSGELGEQGVQS
ncbi:MAG: hypothetical protein OJJ21_00800 [Ferrovibrio sp.]|uniref:tyrosine-type recombinase/integrase n=1 Tax=Ferrovibrio sp. TaxID=1917215 RepID=UPI00260625C7|nr:hypothetical protein [Ferrovibrio sp.]MCW0232116.1 hypothetical protein [Ferrovibrio sp.]